MQTIVWVRCWPPNQCLLAGSAHLGAPQRPLAALLAGGLAMAALQVRGCSSPLSSRASPGRWAVHLQPERDGLPPEPRLREGWEPAW